MNPATTIALNNVVTLLAMARGETVVDDAQLALVVHPSLTPKMLDHLKTPAGLSALNTWANDFKNSAALMDGHMATPASSLTAEDEQAILNGSTAMLNSLAIDVADSQKLPE